MRKQLHQIKRASKKPDFFKILFLRTIGNFLVLLSLFLIAKTFYKPVNEEIRYFVENLAQKRYVVASTSPSESPIPGIKEIEANKDQPKNLLAQVLKIEPVEVLRPKDPNFSIIIPKIGANSNVVANTNAADYEEYLNVLERGVAHASGTAFPGEGGHIFLFAHSTDYFWNVGTYNAVFYLLYKLEKQDEIDLFYKGQRLVYRVIDKRIVDPSQVEYLTRKTNKEFLTLQTCWPAGTTLKRLLVFAAPVVQ